MRGKAAKAENAIKTIKRRLYMTLRHRLETCWSKYLKRATLSVNLDQTPFLDGITPLKAHNNKMTYDRLIRQRRSLTKTPIVNETSQNEKKAILNKFKKSSKSKGLSPGSFVMLPNEKANYGDKNSYDRLVSIFS